MFAQNPQGEKMAEAAYFILVNRNKRPITVDIRTPDGQDIIRKLACESDVVIEKYKIGQLKKYGLNYDSRALLKSNLIYCSVTGFGQTGQCAQRPGYYFII